MFGCAVPSKPRFLALSLVFIADSENNGVKDWHVADFSASPIVLSAVQNYYVQISAAVTATNQVQFNSCSLSNGGPLPDFRIVCSSACCCCCCCCQMLFLLLFR